MLNEGGECRANRDTYRRFPFKGISEFSTDMGAKWVNEDVACLWRISRTISSISVRSSGASSRHRSYTIDIRFRRECQSVDNLFERRASNVSHLRNRARARARARTFVAAFWISHLFRARPLCQRTGLTFFGRDVY